MSDKSQETVHGLAEQEFPVKCFIVHLGADRYKPFRKRIKALGIAPGIRALVSGGQVPLAIPTKKGSGALPFSSRPPERRSGYFPVFFSIMS